MQNSRFILNVFMQNLRKFDGNYEMASGRAYLDGLREDQNLCNIFQNKMNDIERSDSLTSILKEEYRWTRIYRVAKAWGEI